MQANVGAQPGVARLIGSPDSAYDDNRASGVADYLLGNAADEKTHELSMTTAADHDQIGLPVLCEGDDLLCGITEGRLG